MKKTVFATREGLVGGRTASGYFIDKVVSFVALPAVKALRRHVRIENPLNGRSCVAQVLDVGPWNETDDPYVFGAERPAAEKGVGKYRKPVNPAGIDLGEAVWAALGMKTNGNVVWEFID